MIACNLPEYGFSLTRIFPYKDRIEYSVLMRGHTGQRKPVVSYFVHSGDYSQVALYTSEVRIGFILEDRLF